MKNNMILNSLRCMVASVAILGAAHGSAVTAEQFNVQVPTTVIVAATSTPIGPNDQVICNLNIAGFTMPGIDSNGDTTTVGSSALTAPDCATSMPEGDTVGLTISNRTLTDQKGDAIANNGEPGATTLTVDGFFSDTAACTTKFDEVILTKEGGALSYKLSEQGAAVFSSSQAYFCAQANDADKSEPGDYLFEYTLAAEQGASIPA